MTIDNYMENKIHNEFKNEIKNITNKESISLDKKKKIKIDNNKIIEEKKEQERKIFKLNVLTFDSFDTSNKINIIIKNNKENKPHKVINKKITSKSLPYKKEKNKTNQNYEFSTDDYAKIIEKNKIKRVNTVKKFNISKK